MKIIAFESPEYVLSVKRFFPKWELITINKTHNGIIIRDKSDGIQKASQLKAIIAYMQDFIDYENLIINDITNIINQCNNIQFVKVINFPLYTKDIIKSSLNKDYIISITKYGEECILCTIDNNLQLHLKKIIFEHKLIIDSYVKNIDNMYNTIITINELY